MCRVAAHPAEVGRDPIERGRDPDLHVDGDDAGRRRDDGIEIHLRDLRDLVSEKTHPEDHVFEGSHVDGRPAAIAEQELRAAQRTHHIMRVLVGHGNESERAVGKQLSRHSPQSEEDEWTERPVVGDTQDQLDAGVDHRLDDRAGHRRAQ